MPKPTGSVAREPELARAVAKEPITKAEWEIAVAEAEAAVKAADAAALKTRETLDRAIACMNAAPAE